jgi:hypothetical protein
MIEMLPRGSSRCDAMRRFHASRKCTRFYVAESDGKPRKKRGGEGIKTQKDDKKIAS